jgi:hypothetical protein
MGLDIVSMVNLSTPFTIPSGPAEPPPGDVITIFAIIRLWVGRAV